MWLKLYKLTIFNLDILCVLNIAARLVLNKMLTFKQRVNFPPFFLQRLMCIDGAMMFVSITCCMYSNKVCGVSNFKKGLT